MNKLHTGVPEQFDSITIIPIERVRFYKENMREGFWAYGSKEPVAIIVRDAQGIRVLDLKSTEISMKSLQQKIPELITLDHNKEN